MRKNIFDLANEMGFDPKFELEQLNFLFFEESVRLVTLNGELNRFFRKYPRNLRLGKLNLVDYFAELVNMRHFSKITDIELLFLESEFLINYWDYIEKYYVDHLDFEIKGRFYMVLNNIYHFLELSNHEILTRSDGTKIIVEKNVSASAVSQIVSETDENVALKILEYNWFVNQGNIESKQIILKQIADYLEPQRQEMNSSNLSEILNTKNNKVILIDNLFYMFNQLNVRHNAETQKMNDFSDEEKETWYDDIYNTALLVILSKEQIRVQEKLRELK